MVRSVDTEPRPGSSGSRRVKPDLSCPRIPAQKNKAERIDFHSDKNHRWLALLDQFRVCPESNMLIFHLIRFFEPIFSSNVHQYFFCLCVGSICFYLMTMIGRTVGHLRSLPNGPWGLPFVGYLPFLESEVYLQFSKFSKKYGPVFSLKLGQQDVIVLNDWPSIKEALVSKELLARPKDGLVPGLKLRKSFVDMSGPDWNSHRQKINRVFRNFGWGTFQMEEKVRDEILRFTEQLDGSTKRHKSCDLITTLGSSISNIISILIFGRRYEYNDPRKIKLDHTIENFLKSAQAWALSIFSPLLLMILNTVGLINMDKIRQIYREYRAQLTEEINWHFESSNFNNNESVKDFIDGYIQEKLISHEADFHQRDQPISICDDITLEETLEGLQLGGIESTKDILCWLMALLVRYPNHQETIRQEILTHIGLKRIPSYEDRHCLPFTMAFLAETHRYSSVSALGLLRRADDDVEIGRYNIPKDSIVMFNLYAVHHDPTLWESPENFCPERFLLNSGTKLKTPPYLIPFGGGKRRCPGEELAKVELFLYLTILLQRYRIKARDILPRLDAEFNLTRRLKFVPKLVYEKIV